RDGVHHASGHEEQQDAGRRAEPEAPDRPAKEHEDDCQHSEEDECPNVRSHDSTPLVLVSLRTRRSDLKLMRDPPRGDRAQRPRTCAYPSMSMNAWPLVLKELTFPSRHSIVLIYQSLS